MAQSSPYSFTRSECFYFQHKNINLSVGVPNPSYADGRSSLSWPSLIPRLLCRRAAPRVKHREVFSLEWHFTRQFSDNLSTPRHDFKHQFSLFHPDVTILKSHYCDLRICVIRIPNIAYAEGPRGRSLLGKAWPAVKIYRVSQKEQTISKYSMLKLLKSL